MKIETKRPISLTVFGILSIACGLFILYTFVFYLLNKPWIALDFHFGQLDSWFFVSCLIFPPALVAGFIVSGIGVLRVMPWSRYFLLITTGFALWGLVNRLIILGPCTEEFFYMSRFFVGGLFIWFFNRKSVRTVFSYRKGLKVIAIVWIAVLSFEIIGAGILWFKYGGHKIPTLQKAVYESRDEGYYSENYLRSPFPLAYTLAIPREFTLFLIVKNDIIGMDIVLCSPPKGLISMSDPTFLQRICSEGKVFGYRNPYRYYEKFQSERFGLFFIILRIIEPMGIKRIENTQIDGLSAFIERGKVNERMCNIFYLFRRSEVIGHGHISGFNRQQMDDIISSLKPQEKPLKSAKEFFRDGQALLKGKDFEKAKFSFVSALCLNWENPQYHYYLGRTFFETENWFSAKQHLEKAMNLQPHYPEAQELLREVEIRKDKGISEK